MYTIYLLQSSSFVSKLQINIFHRKKRQLVRKSSWKVFEGWFFTKNERNEKRKFILMKVWRWILIHFKCAYITTRQQRRHYRPMWIRYEVQLICQLQIKVRGLKMNVTWFAIRCLSCFKYLLFYMLSYQSFRNDEKINR